MATKYVSCVNDKGLCIVLIYGYPGRRDGNETIWKREPDKAPDILTEIIAHEERKALFRRIAGCLTVRQAQVFRLHILEGYSQGEVAEMLGCTAANISMCVRRIREKLMDVMDARDMGES